MTSPPRAGSACRGAGHLHEVEPDAVRGFPRNGCQEGSKGLSSERSARTARRRSAAAPHVRDLVLELVQTLAVVVARNEELGVVELLLAVLGVLHESLPASLENVVVEALRGGVELAPDADDPVLDRSVDAHRGVREIAHLEELLLGEQPLDLLESRLAPLAPLLLGAILGPRVGVATGDGSTEATGDGATGAGVGSVLLLG